MLYPYAVVSMNGGSSPLSTLPTTVVHLESMAYIDLANARDGDRIAHYREALALLGPNGDVNLRAQAYIGLANALSSQKKNLEAFQHFVQAYSLQKNSNRDADAVNTYQLIMRKQEFILQEAQKRYLEPELENTLKFFWPNWQDRSLTKRSRAESSTNIGSSRVATPGLFPGQPSRNGTCEFPRIRLGH